jgi:hypothetical protein
MSRTRPESRDNRLNQNAKNERLHDTDV